MKKSEQIIVSLVVVATLYGAADYFMTNMAKKGNNPVAHEVDLTAVTSRIAAISSGKTGTETKLAKNLCKPWTANVFFSKHPNELKNQERDSSKNEEMLEFNQKAESFIYSGYLEMDNTRIAIINGLDYREGEMVDGFVIDKIKKKMVQLSRQGFLFNITATTIDEAGI